MARSYEDESEDKRLRELKKKMLRAISENGSLRKALRQAQHKILELQEIVDTFMDKEMAADITDLKVTTKKEQKKHMCQKCKSSDTVTMVLKCSPYYKCNECGSKGRISE